MSTEKAQLQPLLVKVFAKTLGNADVGFTLCTRQHIDNTQLKDAALAIDDCFNNNHVDVNQEIQGV